MLLTVRSSEFSSVTSSFPELESYLSHWLTVSLIRRALRRTSASFWSVSRPWSGGTT